VGEWSIWIVLVVGAYISGWRSGRAQEHQHHYRAELAKRMDALQGRTKQEADRE